MMKKLKYCIISLSLVSLFGCTTSTKDITGHKIEREGLNTTLVYHHSDLNNTDSLYVIRHWFGKNYYLEDFECDGRVDRIHISIIDKSFYRIDPITKKEIQGYDKRLFKRADDLLAKYKLELGIDDNSDDSSLIKYLD